VQQTASQRQCAIFDLFYYSLFPDAAQGITAAKRKQEASPAFLAACPSFSARFSLDNKNKIEHNNQPCNQGDVAQLVRAYGSYP
jgi:hypothetical protein